MPGDRRGWVDKHDAGAEVPYKGPDPQKETMARARMTESPVWLKPDARDAVGAAIRETCALRGWFIHALNVRSNHVHIVVTVGEQAPGAAMKALKAYGTRALSGLGGGDKRRHWWTEGGSKRYLNDERSLAAAVRYVLDQ